MDRRQRTKRATRALLAAYWAGVIADAFMGIALLTPSLWGSILGIENFSPDLQHRLDLGVASSLMFGWTGLLLWASRDPVARRGVLGLTLFPVITGLGATTALAVAGGTLALGDVLGVVALKVILVGLLGYALFVSRGVLEMPPRGDQDRSA